MPAPAPGQWRRAQFFDLEGNFFRLGELVFEKLPRMLGTDFNASVVERLFHSHCPEARRKRRLHLPAAILGAGLRSKVICDGIHAVYGMFDGASLVGLLWCGEVAAVGRPHSRQKKVSCVLFP